MADLGISIAAKLIEVVGSAVIKEICDSWGYKSQLEELNQTVSTIKNVLLDAEAKRELSNEARGYIEELRAALYDADDLFDEVFTLAELNQLRPLSKRGKLFEKVRRFFSSKNQAGQAYRMSRQVKEIKKQLDGIVSNHQKFGFSVDYKPICRRREETCSYVRENTIIGREKDKKVVIDMLLGLNSVHEDDCFVTIVGVGGLGKTALAQLVYNDEKVVKEFPDLRLWVCVSDQDGEPFDVKAILCKILAVVSDVRPDSTSLLEWVQNQLQLQLRGKKYLLVLDDVWNEDRGKWLSLKDFLMVGQRGSRIVVTTRSETTAKIIGGKHIHKLEGLSQKYSWLLFESVAFDKEQEDLDQFVDIGKRIVLKCFNIPLAIKVVGSLLYGQLISRWESFEQSGWADIGEGGNEIMSVLKLSYHNLRPSLKNCFSYCAVFPKDVEIERETLISLWMAQGYIVPLDRGQSIEDAGEEYFLILLRRCFFQDVRMDDYGVIETVKIHDLMHDVAQEVGRQDICVVTSDTIPLGDKVRHVVYGCDNILRSTLVNSRIRSLLNSRDAQIKSWMCSLRVLELSYANITSLPDSIGKLLHLRFLDLSRNDYLGELSDSTTELHNLQTLLLNNCNSLRKLPKDFCKLVKLRHLDLIGCHDLTGMPSGMCKLTSLKVLPVYVAGKDERASTEEQYYGALQDLQSLTNLRGDVNIQIGKNYSEGTNDEGGYLKSMKHLTGVQINFYDGFDDYEGVMEKLEPPPNIKGFIVFDYEGTVIPRWGRAEDIWAISFPHLVKIKLSNCKNLEQLPSLCELRYLKSLHLNVLDKLEYMENRSSRNSSDEGEESPIFFPSLECLCILSLGSLKGWRKEELVEDAENHKFRGKLIFPRLSELIIMRCSNLMAFPCSPSLEILKLQYNNKKLRIDDYVRNSQDEIRLRDVEIDDVGCLQSLHSPCLTSLKIVYDDNVQSLSEYGEAFRSHASSLKSLMIRKCRNLKRLSGEGGGLEFLTALESLQLSQLALSEDGADDGDMPWKSLQSLRNLKVLGFGLPKGIQYLTSLQTLSIEFFKKLKTLPPWIGCLSSLQYLTIRYCNDMKSLPDSIRNLTSLQKLEIYPCSVELQERCKAPNGEDWPKIQHIPHIDIRVDW